MRGWRAGAAMKTLLFLPNAFLHVPTPTRVATTATTLPDLLAQVQANVASLLPSDRAGVPMAVSFPVEDGARPVKITDISEIPAKAKLMLWSARCATFTNRVG